MKDHCFERKSLFDRGGFKPVSVGGRLRVLRTSSGYSIKALAEKSGLAVNTLSLIENERTSPSVNTLEQLAKALGVPLTCFFEPTEDKPRLIWTKKGNRQEVIMEDVRIEDCGLSLDGQPMQPLIVTLPASAPMNSEPTFHPGFEFVYCLSGQVDYYVEDKKYSLQEGDSLALDALLPHFWVNAGEKPAVYLLIMIPGDVGDLSGDVHFHPNGESDE